MSLEECRSTVEKRRKKTSKLRLNEAVCSENKKSFSLGKPVFRQASPRSLITLEKWVYGKEKGDELKWT